MRLFQSVMRSVARHLWNSQVAVRSRQLASTTLEGVDTQSVVATRIVLWGKFQRWTGAGDGSFDGARDGIDF